MTPKTPRRKKTGSWHEAVDAFTSHLSREHSPHTVTNYKDYLRAFATWWTATNPGETLTPGAVTDFDVREWKRHLKEEVLTLKDGTEYSRMPATINARIAGLKSFLRWAWNGKLIAELPAMPRREKLAARSVKSLDARQLRQLRGEAARDRNPRNPALVDAFVGTGVRVAEGVALRRKDVTLGPKKGTVEVREGKGCKPRSIPIDQETRDAFRTLLALEPAGEAEDPILLSQRTDGKGKGARKPLTARGVQELLARYARNLAGRFPGEGWEDGLHPHQLRHTYAIALRDSMAKKGKGGINWPVIASLLGHSSVVTTMDVYGTPSDRDRRRAVDPDADDD